MTDTTTEAVERLMKDVTPGPWVEVIELDRDGDDDAINLWADIVCVHRCGLGFDGGIDDIIKANARFIAATRELVPALLADRDRLAALLAASQSPDPVTNADSCQPTRSTVPVQEAAKVLLGDDEACLRLAEAYDREDGAQRGEPSPHVLDRDEPDYAEWAQDRVGCAKAALRAIAEGGEA